VSEARLVLEVIGGDGRQVELPRAGALSIGSAAGRADLVVAGTQVGEVHCVVGRVKGGGWAVKDLGTPAGTWLDGARVESAKLEAGAELRLGSARLRVVDPDAPRAAPPAPAPAPAPAQTTAAPALSATTLAAIKALGPVSGYRILGALGRGGMGQVFLAVQESLQRKVALKVLAEKLSADADFVRRFQAEARAAAALNHPNIVTVHDVWEERGRHFLSMEYMDGGTLEERVVRDGRLPARDVVEILSDAAKGLVFAELRGIVHKDIKPANLMVNEVGTTKIADLGLATHLEAEATEDAGGKIYGTPHFIAPEQARGERVDARADLYSLGATAYRLISGRTPFEGATTRDILRGHFFETPRPLGEFVPDVPHALSSLVARLLAKLPAERVASAGALLTELERIKLELVHGVPALGAAAPARRSRAVPIGVAVLVLGAAAGWFLFGRGAQDSSGDPTAGVHDPSDPFEQDSPADPAQHDPGAAAPGSAVTAGDDDQALEELEQNAQRAWADLSSSLDDEARRAELLALAKTYAGTTAAARFTEEAAAIEARGNAAAAGAQSGERQVLSSIEQLALAAKSAADANVLGTTLSALAAVEVDERLRLDPQFQAGARKLWLEAMGAATARAAQTLEQTDRSSAAGEFEGLAEPIEQARVSLLEDAWPPLPANLQLEDSEELARLRETRAALTARAAGLEVTRTRWHMARERADRAAQAAVLQVGQGFERELRNLDLAACDTRLAALQDTLPLEQSRSRCAALRTDLRAAGVALEALGSAWKAGTWKRRTLNDPRQRGRVSREAVGADAKGLLLKEGESVEHLPWSAFGGRPAELHQLFHERLTRSFTSEELLGIATLVRTAAVLQAIAEGQEILVPGSGGVLSAEETRSMLEGFEVARPWAELADRLEPLERERAAAAVALLALQSANDEQFGRSAAALERLLAEHRDSLLVRLLSDGSVVADLDAQLPPPPPESLPDPPRVVENEAPVDASPTEPAEPTKPPAGGGSSSDQR
jgi:hypothetical protein